MLKDAESHWNDAIQLVQSTKEVFGVDSMENQRARAVRDYWYREMHSDSAAYARKTAILGRLAESEELVQMHQCPPSTTG